MEIRDGLSTAAFMTPAHFEPNAWIEELARALAGLASAQNLYWDDLDRHRQQHIRSHAERRWSIVPLHPSDYLKSFYFHACHSESRDLAQHYAPLRAAYANVRAVLAAHPSWSDFVDPYDGSGEFSIQTATGGGPAALFSIIGGLMARAMELGANRFITAATELHDLLEPAREPKAPPAPGDLSVGYHVVLLQGLTMSDKFQIAEDMALMPFEQMRDFVNETQLSDVAPNIIKFNAWKSVSAIVKPFHWKPAFGEHDDDTRPKLDWGRSFFEDAQIFVELLAMFHAGPVVCLVRHLQNSWPTVEQASGFGCKLVTRAQGTGIEAPIHEETQARPGIGRGSGKSCRLLRVGSWVDRGHHVTDGYVTRRMSWSAVSASTPNMQWHITFAGPRTRTWRPPNSSLRRPLTRSTAVRSL